MWWEIKVFSTMWLGNICWPFGKDECATGDSDKQITMELHYEMENSKDLDTSSTISNNWENY